MLLVQGLLLLCSLFAVGTCTCYSTNPQPAETCLQLFDEFKSALNTKLNVFSLQDLFNPSLDTVPSLANITYVLYYNMSPEVEPCPKSPDDNTNFTNVTETCTKDLTWSISGVYDVINPIMLHLLQPQLLQGLLGLISCTQYQNSDLDALLWDGTKPLGGVVLNLNLSLHCIPTEAQVDSLLARATSRLTTYAKESKVSNGYAIEDIESGKKEITAYIILLHFLSLVVPILILAVVSKHSPGTIKEFQKQENTKTAKYGMLVYVILEFVFEIVLSSMFLSGQVEGQDQDYKAIIIIKIVILFITFVFYFLLCLVTACILVQEEKPEDTSTCKIILEYILPFFALLSFAYFMLTTIVPFVMLVFVYPMWASSFLLLITVIFVAVHSTIYMHTGRRDSLVKRYLTSSSVLCIIFILLVYFYIFELFIIYARGVASGGTVKTIIFQIIPSGLLTFVYWLINKLALHTEKKNAKEHSSHSFRNWLKKWYKFDIQGNKSDETERLPSHQEMQESHTQGPDEQQPRVQGEGAPLVNTAAQSYNTC